MCGACVCVGGHPLEQLDEQPSVGLGAVGLQPGEGDQLVEQPDKEDVVVSAEAPPIQLQEPEVDVIDDVNPVCSTLIKDIKDQKTMSGHVSCSLLVGFP